MKENISLSNKIKKRNYIPNPKDILSRESGMIVKNKMENLNKTIEDEFKQNPSNFTLPPFRFYTNKNVSKKSIFDKKKCFITSLFINESYLPSTFIWAQSFRNQHTKYPIICLIQDKPYQVNKNTTFEGISKKIIKELLQFFDMVIGTDLIEVKGYKPPRSTKYPDLRHVTEEENYKNIRFYVTKMKIVGLTQFEQIFYIDSAAYIGENIDFVFEKYNGNYFHSLKQEYEFHQTGAGGSHFMIKPKITYYYKLILLVKKYHYFFSDLFFKNTVDETILYYSIFPHWTGIIDLFSILCYKRWTKGKPDCPIRHFQKYKPFRKLPNKNNYTQITPFAFEEWDLLAKQVIQHSPNLIHYYEPIGKIRKTIIFS